MIDTEVLNADELIHLALDATNRSLNGQAIEYLKRLLAIQPDNADAHYLLGAQQAQIGMFDRAVASMSRALEIRADLHAARFQLGLLLSTSGRIEEAQRVWQPLDSLGGEHFFVLFKTGVLHIARDEFEQGIGLLQRGIQVNGINAPLNDEMGTLIEHVRAMQGLPAPAQASDAASATDVPPMFLDAYNVGKTH
jgi:tetratricopeptide (TPR) repeat protein